MASRPSDTASPKSLKSGLNISGPATSTSSSSSSSAFTGGPAPIPSLVNPAASTVKSRPSLPQRLSGLPHSLKLNLRKGSNRTGVPSETNAELLGLLCVRVIAARNLASKDRNGKSDPFLVFRVGEARAESEVVKASLNPIWGLLDGGEKDLPHSDGRSRKEACCIAPMWAETLQKLRIEVVAWDKDSFKRNEYLGELSLGVEDWLDTSNPQIPVSYTAINCQASTYTFDILSLLSDRKAHSHHGDRYPLPKANQRFRANYL